MVALVKVETLRNRLALPDDDGINAIIESALSGATAYVEAKLKTSVAAGDGEDWFRVDETSLTKDETYHLMLSNGFVQDVVVESSDTFGGTTSAVTVMKVHDEKGMVIVSSDVSKPTYFKVTYAYGFADEESVPTWLQEVAMAYAVQLMSMQQVNDQKEEMSKLYKFVQSHGVEVLDAHLRRDSFAIRPMV